MSSVTVDSTMIQKVIRNCTDSITRLERTKLSLHSRYQEQSSTWSDSKYQYLGSIIAECNTAIGKVIAELAGCVSKLEQVNTYIQEYEDIDFISSDRHDPSNAIYEFFTSRFGNNATTADEGTMFCGFVMLQHPMKRDTMIIPGTHYPDYVRLLQNADSYSFDDFIEHRTDYIRNVLPDSIEGLHLSISDATNPQRFWNRDIEHEIDSETYFNQIASLIPQVQCCIDAGESLDAIYSDPMNEVCYNMYFRSPICVVDCGGYYEFSGNGRHRLLAARQHGYPIPVHITGQFVINNE